jgi:hypothetical protein
MRRASANQRRFIFDCSPAVAHSLPLISRNVGVSRLAALGQTTPFPWLPVAILHFATKRAFRSRISKFAFRGPLVIVDGAHELAGALIHVNAADCPTQISAKHDEGKLEFA